MPVVKTIEGEFFGRPFEFHLPLETGSTVELSWEEGADFSGVVRELVVTGEDTVAIQSHNVVELGTYRKRGASVGPAEILSQRQIQKEVSNHPLGLFGVYVLIVWQPS